MNDMDDDGKLWVGMWSKIRLVGKTRVELYHMSESDTGSERGRIILAPEDIRGANLKQAARTRRVVWVEVSLAAMAEAGRGDG
jgi:hypothetical protein